MKIPISFELQGRTIRVIRSEDVPFKNDAWACWDADSDRITLDPTAPKDMRAHSFLHEFLHAALEACGRDDLSSDEKLVDALAGLTHQMLKTSKF